MHRAPDYQRRTKKPVNLSISTDLLEEARVLNINLSQLLEKSLSEAVSKARAIAWREENREAIEGYNALIAERGSFGDRHRRF